MKQKKKTKYSKDMDITETLEIDRCFKKQKLGKISFEEENIYLKKMLMQNEKEITELKKKNLSLTNANAALKGRRNEQQVCDFLNCNPEKRKSLFPMDFDYCNTVNDGSKIDIMSKNGLFSAQVKTTNGTSEQLDRHYFEDMFKHKLKLEDEEYNKLEIFKTMCEYEVDEKGFVKKNSEIKAKKAMAVENYNQEQLNSMLEILNKHKTKILDFVFLGITPKKPLYFIGRYLNMYYVFLMKDILFHLNKHEFRIKEKGKGKYFVIQLGSHQVMTFQRKGGDGEKKTSNQIATKINISKLIGDTTIPHRQVEY